MAQTRRWFGLRALACPALVVVVVIVPQVGAGGDQPTTFEITWADTSASYSDEVAWGFWNRSKYNTWSTQDADGDAIAEGRYLMRHRRFVAFVAVERSPVLRASGDLAGTTTPQWHQLTAKMMSYDLAWGKRFGAENSSGLMPWLGITVIKVEERRQAFPDSNLTAGPDQQVDRANSRLWGAVAGVDGEYRFLPRWAATGRLVARWAKGSRKGTIFLDDTTTAAPGKQGITEVHLSDSTERGMLGGELALRWLASAQFKLEGGWRYRDWQYDHGFGDLSGPFLRLIIDL